MAQKGVPKAVLLDGAQMALSGLLAGTMGFLKERNIPVEEWVSYMAERFEGMMGALEGEGIDHIMEHLLTLQVLPMGAEVISSQGGTEKAEVTLTPLPSRTVLEKFGTTPRELLRDFGVTQKDIASIYGMYEPAAKAIGLRFTHQIKGSQQLLSLEQVPRRNKPGARSRAKKL